MKFRPDHPYNELPALPPAVPIESRLVLKACIGARAALASLQQATALLPNPSVLINTIPLLEAQASSEIENVVTTTDALFRHAQLEATADAATKEALRYRTALRRGFESMKRRPLSTATAVDICSLVKGIDTQVRRVPGTALASGVAKQVIYTPPAGEALLREKLANWERFVHSDADIDPIVKMAVAHYQFEAIHPFTDGNGRTGRILNLLMLINDGVLDQPVLYLSGYIIRHKSAYYRLLLDVTRKRRWEPWILFMLEAVAVTSRWTHGRIVAIRNLMEQTARELRSKFPKIYTRELLEVLFQQPYCRIENIVDAGLAKRETASTYLRTLAKGGLLKEYKIGREKLFLNSRYLRLLQSDRLD